MKEVGRTSEELCPPAHPWALCYSQRLVTESKLMLPAARQANKPREELFGQEIVTLFRKPADREDGGPVSPRTIPPKLEFRLLLY